MKIHRLYTGMFLVVSFIFLFFLQPLVSISVDTSQYPNYPEGLTPLNVKDLFNFCPNSIYHEDDAYKYLIDLTGPKEPEFTQGRFSCQVWSKEMINLSEPFILEFYGYFGNTECGGTVADGLALSFRNGGPTHAGYRGAGMGVYGDGLSQNNWQSDALGKAHVLEFDTYYNILGNHHGDVRDHDADLKNHLKNSV